MPPPSLPPQRYKSHAASHLVPAAPPVPPTFRRDTLDPQVTPRTRKRKGISPFMLLAFGLMALLVAYGSGNLPQADAFFNSAVQSLHSNSDSIVTSILNAGPMILKVGFGILAGIVLLLWSNSYRSRDLGD